MGKKIGLLVLLMFVMPLAVTASTIPLNLTVEVDFQGPTEFVIRYLPYGYESYFHWDNGSTHADRVLYPVIPYELDEEKYCTESTNKINQYQNITTSFVSMSSLCNGIMSNLNTSVALTEKARAAESSKNEYERLWKIEEFMKSVAQNQSNLYLNEKNEYKTNYENCNSRLEAANSYRRENDEYKTKYEQSEKSKQNLMLIAGAVGIGIGYMIWRNKSPSSGRRSSEQEEAGTTGDDLGYDGPRM